MIHFRHATLSDMLLYYNWANDPVVRENSFQTKIIPLENHKSWFEKKINNNNTIMLVFENESKIPVGQVRLERENSIGVISISVDDAYRGAGYSVPMLKQAATFYFSKFVDDVIHAYIKKVNQASVKSFEKAGFSFDQDVIINEEPSLRMVKKNER